MTETVLPPSPSEGVRPSDDAPDLSVRAVSVLLLYFRREYGEERLRQLWSKYQLGLSLEYVSTLTNFISFDFTEQLIDALVAESGDPHFSRKAGRLFVTPDAMGFLYHALRIFGSVKAVYAKFIEVVPTLNRVGKFTIEASSSNHMVLSYLSRRTERNRNLCEGRMAQFASVPTIWDLPPAQMVELQCQARGADCCRYELTWHEPVRGWRLGAGMLMGVAVGTGMGLLNLGPLPVLVPSVALGAAFFGAWMDARQEVRRKDEYLAAQNEGLMQSLTDLERRYDEVCRSNLALEDRVAARTQELTEANSKLATALDTQKELIRLKSEFFDNVSHELRTPLTLILLSLESLLQRDPSAYPDAMRQHLMTMERSAHRLLKLINNLLDLAQMEAGKLRLRYQAVELHGLLSSLLPPFRVMAEKKGLSLTLEGGPVGAIHGDVERIEVVFQNLVSNALKFTQQGAVRVRVSEDAGSVYVEVEDTGPGIAPQDIPVIFDRFAQADSTGTRRFGGTGIGLALVKETVDLHSGDIEVSSEVGKGATFRVQLPKGTAHIREDLRDRRAIDMPARRDRRTLPALTALRPGGAAVEPSSVPEELAPSNAPRILVVEDEPEIRDFVVSVLRTSYRVLEAVNGEEGRQRALQTIPDLIVSDVMMPVMSGLQMLAALRERQETADIPVILLTARQEVAEKVEGLGTGANDYIGKPFSPRELLARIEAQLRLRDAAVRAAENERLAATGLLTSGFAHEVRNPLNGLMNAMLPLRESILGSQVDPDTTRAMLDVMEECGTRIRHLAESLLSFVRTSDRLVPVNLGASLDSTLSVLAWKIPPDVVVVRDYQCDVPITGDPGSLNQVWVNLLDNAVRAVGTKGQVKISTEHDGATAVVSITDTGTGIKPEDMERLFQPFFSTRAAGEGTGLGLALCRRIVLRHGGLIHLTSEWGQGTRCEVRLPVQGVEHLQHRGGPGASPRLPPGPGAANG
ncbi:Signal transduction histidine kinase [Stigmatella aurantiaca]|uniref:histidine kinase n=1 Tax=Stigmatella aurantiaca TaxID=41 RepID=A0A1H7UHR2_STIAU|nr:Signal transduction histidine kinase [Stigmatella aurantiaca]